MNMRVLGSCFLSVLLLIPALAEAVIVVSPPGVTCATDPRLTSPVTGQDFCFDSTTRVIMTWTGSLWAPMNVQTTGGVGSYGIRNLVGQNNPGTPNSRFDYSADLVVLRNPSDGTTTARTSTGTLTNDVLVAGSTANGRDQAGAFGANSWIHFYFIWNGSTLATLSSLTAPSTGPTLPSGYTHWAYGGAVRYNATPVLVRTLFRGAWAMYETGQVALSGGTATSETPIPLTAFVPPNALEVQALVNLSAQHSVANSGVISLRIATGVDYIGALFAMDNAGQLFRLATQFRAPNVSQNISYLFGAPVPDVARSVNVVISGYKMPNGGE